MTLFWTAIRRDLDSLLEFPFRSHVQVFLCEISFVCRLKYLYSCISSHFCFLVVVVYHFAVCAVSGHINKSCFAYFYVFFESLYWYIFNAGESSSSFFYLTRIVYLCHLWVVRPYASPLIFLFSGPFCLSFSLVHFKNGSDYPTRTTAQVFSSLFSFPLQSVVSRSFLVRLRYSFFIFFFFSTLWYPLPIFPLLVGFLFSVHSDSFLIW